MKTSSVINNQVQKLSLTLFGEIYQGNLGGTFDFDSNKIDFKNGFMVSKKAPSIILEKSKFSKMKYWDFAEMLKTLYFKADSFDYLGYWVESGVIYFDLSRNIKNKSEAIQFGLYNQQIAIWDCENQTSINLDNYKL